MVIVPIRFRCFAKEFNSLDNSKVFFNFWHEPVRENPSAPLEKSALKMNKTPSLKITFKLSNFIDLMALFPVHRSSEWSWRIFPYLSMSKNGKTKKNSGKSNAADVVQGKNFLVISLIICILFYLFCVALSPLVMYPQQENQVGKYYPASVLLFLLFIILTYQANNLYPHLRLIEI